MAAIPSSSWVRAGPRHLHDWLGLEHRHLPRRLGADSRSTTRDQDGPYDAVAAETPSPPARPNGKPLTGPGAILRMQGMRQRRARVAPPADGASCSRCGRRRPAPGRRRDPDADRPSRGPQGRDRRPGRALPELRPVLRARTRSPSDVLLAVGGMRLSTRSSRIHPPGDRRGWGGPPWLVPQISSPGAWPRRAAATHSASRAAKCSPSWTRSNGPASGWSSPSTRIAPASWAKASITAISPRRSWSRRSARASPTP